MATVELAHDITGSGPLLVLVHGITEDRRSWDPLLPELVREHRVLRVDLRGHGESPTADSYGLADYAGDIAALVGDEPPLVIGHSLGGAVATAYAAAFPVRAAVNVDQPLDLVAFQAAVRAEEPVLRSDAFRPAMYALFDQMRGTVSDAEWARLSALRDPRQSVVLGSWALLLEQSADELDAAVTAAASAVQAPYLSLFGIDPGADYPAWLTARIPQARIETWSGLGHYPHLVEPERFLTLVRDFESTI